MFLIYTVVQLYLFGVINTELIEVLRIENPREFGVLVSAQFYGLSLLLIPAGLLFDRCFPKKLMWMAGMVAVMMLECCVLVNKVFESNNDATMLNCC